MTIVEANPTDNHLIPYQEACVPCDNLRRDPQPGLHSWCMELGRHMQDDHKITMVYAA